jgi:hypothetical protein
MSNQAAETTSSDDLYTALALVESGLFGDPGSALSFARTLATHDFVEGVSFRSSDLRSQLSSAGKRYFFTVFASVRNLLCTENAVRTSTRVGAEFVFFVIEIIVAHTGVGLPIASLVARIVVSEGLENLCRS